MSIHQLQSNVGGKLGLDRALADAAPRPVRTRATRRVTFGVIVGNRGFFPGHLARTGREEILRTLDAAGYGAVIVGAEETNYGAIESRDEAKLCAELFQRHRAAIDGIIVTLPNFGDERGIGDTIRLAGWVCRCSCTPRPMIPPKWASMRGATRSAARCLPATCCRSMAFRIR